MSSTRDPCGKSPESPGGILALQDALRRMSGEKIQVELTDNRSRMASVRRGADGLVVLRLQRIFLSSPPEVVAELAALAGGRPAGKKAIMAFIRANPPLTERPPRTAARPPPAVRGGHHDLALYFSHLNETYLNGRSRAEVTWGRRNGRRSRRSIRFGCYDPARNLITMNRKLDAPSVPRYFVEYILFHEMLHEVLGIGERADGRRDIHGRLFRLMESTYPDFESAQRFEKLVCSNLEQL